MYSKSCSIEIMISDDADEGITKHFDSHANRYQNDLQSMKGSEFVFDYVQLLHYKFRRINFSNAGSYIYSPDWIKKSNNKSYQ